MVAAASDQPAPGFGSTAVTGGDHICCLYSGGADRDRILLGYLRAGIRHGEKCVCVVDSTDLRRVVRQVGPSSVDAPEQLVVAPAAEVYRRQGGFSPERMIEYLGESIGAGVGVEGYRFVRAVSEMCWALGEESPDADELLAYEAAVDEFAPRYPQALLCMYDVRRFAGGMIVDMLGVHPKLLVGNVLMDNPLCASSARRSGRDQPHQGEFLVPPTFGEGHPAGSASVRARSRFLRQPVAVAQTTWARESEMTTGKLLDAAADAVAPGRELLDEVRRARERTAREVPDVLERLRWQEAGRRTATGSDNGAPCGEVGERGRR